MFKATHTTCTHEQPTSTKISATMDSVVERTQTRVSRRLLKRTDSNACTRAPSKPFPFYYTHKPIKKRIGFRRRCGNGLNLNIASIRDAHFKSNIVSNAPKRKKKIRRALSPKLPNSTSTLEFKHLTAPKYHISYKKTLAAYKSMRKGSSFYPSRRVLWLNRHRLVLGPRFNKNSFYDDYNFSPKQEKEYFCPEPPEEHEDLLGDDSVCDAQSHVCNGGLVCASNELSFTATSVRESTEENEAPQWLTMGPEYKSDNSGDGPVSFALMPFCELFLKHTAIIPYLLRPHISLRHMGLELCREYNFLSFWQCVISDKSHSTITLQFGDLYLSAETSSTFLSAMESNQEREAPQWTDFGPQYSSDCSGDGPVTDVKSDVGETIQNIQPEVPSVSDATDALSHEDIVDIPEFDPNNNNSLLSNWMRYDPQREGPKRYFCIVCECEAPTKQIIKHVNGKRHRTNLDTKGHLCHESILTLTTLLRSTYNRELRMFTRTNISTMSDALQLLLDADDSFISVAFFIADAQIMCLSLVTATICMNIDRTVFQETDMLKNCKPLKQLFEGSTRLMGGDVWELALVLYHSYSIKFNAFIDVEDFGRDDAGVELPLLNSDLHRRVSVGAIECYNAMDASQAKELSIRNIPTSVLNHISRLNVHMYGKYREVRKTDIILSSVGKFKDAGTICIISHDYNSRVRLNSLVKIYFGDEVIVGLCEEWDCSKTGKLADIILQSPVPRRSYDKMILNRSKEMMMERVLLRHFVTSICCSNFTATTYLNHCYFFQSLMMKKEHDLVFKQKVPKCSRLNEFQQCALYKSLNPMSVIHGPPGTGKTRALAAICQQAVENDEGVLCLSWTNVAVRNICELLKKVLLPGVVAIKTSTEYKCWHQSECQTLKSVEAKGCEVQVLCMTMANYLYSTRTNDSCNKWSSDLMNNRDLIVLDEASQVWELDALMLLHRLRGYKRFVCAGDQKQLSPYVSRLVDDAPSILTWLQRVHGKNTYLIPNTLLRRQYRMMPSIGTVVSRLFYDSKLQHHKNKDGKKHLFFHCMDGKMEIHSTARWCVDDTNRCARIFNRYKTNSPHFKCHVLTYYEAQCRHVKHLYPHIPVCCVDSYQGQEVDVIILLLSLRKCKLSKFILNRGRLCVAISRAKLDLHIVGHRPTMLKNKTWEDILKSSKKIY